MKLDSEAAVLAAMGKENFQHLSKKDIMAFASSIPDMAPEVAIKCIEQFPEFSNYSNGIVKSLNESYDKAMAHSKDLDKEAISAYRFVLDELSDELRQGNISAKRRHEISMQMVEIADKIHQVNKDGKDFLAGIVKYASIAASIAVAAGATILGLKLNDK